MLPADSIETNSVPDFLDEGSNAPEESLRLFIPMTEAELEAMSARRRH